MGMESNSLKYKKLRIFRNSRIVRLNLFLSAQVTICKEWGWTGEVFPDLPILSPCANGSQEFFSAIENCLSNDPTFELPKLMKDIGNHN